MDIVLIKHPHKRPFWQVTSKLNYNRLNKKVSNSQAKKYLSVKNQQTRIYISFYYNIIRYAFTGDFYSFALHKGHA